MTELTAITRNTPAGPVITVNGDLDHYSAGTLRETIRDVTLQPGQLLVLDLQRLAFCDSSGISVFVAAHRQVLAAQARMALVAVPAMIIRTLGIVGLDQVLDIHPDLDHAVRSSSA
ncbi:STAS domain-containing protein [Streptomyces sp. NPDC005551]|uniref:STAS domain-containing protein n=1 Tax=unclassified Streptomyces TaxID=2593676 RepID=UPI0033EE9082